MTDEVIQKIADAKHNFLKVIEQVSGAKVVIMIGMMDETDLIITTNSYSEMNISDLREIGFCCISRLGADLQESIEFE